LKGVDREVAMFGYENALRTIYLAGGCLAILMLLVQAGTGWMAPDVPKDEEGVAVNGQDSVNGRLSPVLTREPVAN
jgi:hypothetical protein